MKKIYILFLLLISSFVFSQTNGITYQAVILNPSAQQIPGVNDANAPLANTAVCLKFAIIDHNSQIEYLETLQTTTDAFGMVNLIIGTGDKIGGYAASFSDILWNSNAKNLKVELSTTGVCSYFTVISNQPFTYVPFAMFALNTENTEAIAAIESLLIDLQIELDAFELGVGLGPNGLYVANPNTNYINTSTSVVDATEDLDAAIAAVQSDVDANETASNAADATLQTNINTLTSTVSTNLSTTNTAIAAVQADVDANETAANTAIALKEDAANKSTDVTLSDTTNTKFPTELAVKTYIDNQVSNGIATNVSGVVAVANGGTGLTAVGTNGQVLTTNNSGILEWTTPSTTMTEVADEYTSTTGVGTEYLTAGKTSFTLAQAPSANSKVKMYVNGIRISNTAYSVSGSTLTYVPANNGGNNLLTTDRVQFDYFY